MENQDKDRFMFVGIVKHVPTPPVGFAPTAYQKPNKRETYLIEVELHPDGSILGAATDAVSATTYICGTEADGTHWLPNGGGYPPTSELPPAVDIELREAMWQVWQEAYPPAPTETH